MAKKKIQNRQNLNTERSEEKQNLIFIIALTILVIALHGNTIFNRYSLDDYNISAGKPVFQEGLRGIPQIFSSVYSSESGLSFGYRPLLRSSYAIEYALFGQNTYVGHGINILLYLIGVLLLYRVLKRIFRNRPLFLPFLATVIFLAHPVHTEAVASLKNRDELFVLIFGLALLIQVLRYADTARKKHLYWSVLFVILGFLSKPTIAAYFMFVPLTLYFFTDITTKRLWMVTGLIMLTGFIAAFVPFLYLPPLDRPMRAEEFPLEVLDSPWLRISYGALTLLFYLRLLVFPHPLRYYYGYDMLPVADFSSVWVILSILLHLGLLVYAIRKFREKNILSYLILSYLGAIAMFSNVLEPAPGIIAERFLMAASIPFSVAVAYGLHKIFVRKLTRKEARRTRLIYTGLLALIIIIPYSAKTYTRNIQWRTQMSLYSHDMAFLYDSVKGNDLYATELMKGVNVELAKPVNVLKFVEPQIQEALSHWERAIEILPGHRSSYSNIGIIYSRVYRNYDTALIYFREALVIDPDHAETYFQIGQAYEGLEKYDSAFLFYKKTLELDTANISTRSRMANLYYRLGEFRKAVEMNQEITRIDPGESLPYVNIGNYYIFQGDTTNAVQFYERAVELGAPAIASKFLSRYYANKGDIRKSNYYNKIARDMERQNKVFIP